MFERPLQVAYSTCPNDTFIFNQLAQCSDVETHLHDVETLNQRAFDQQYDVTKLSYHAWLHLQDSYCLLGAGSALGRGCGPLLVTKPGQLLTPDALIAVPGEFTTAHLLLRLWNPTLKNRIFLPFDQIMGAIDAGDVDGGLLIHEGRFTYEARGFQCQVDLGEWWEGETDLPLPLGCIAARKELGVEAIRKIDERVYASASAAMKDPAATLDYVRKHAQELNEQVTTAHIKTYVNEYSLDLGDVGRAAIAELQRRAKVGGVI